MSRQGRRQGGGGGGCGGVERAVLGEERGGRLAGSYDGMRDEPAQERQVRRDPGDLGLGESGREPVERVVPGSAVRDELRDHRVVGEPDLVALLDTGSRRGCSPAGRSRSMRPAWGRNDPRILGVQAHLDRVPFDLATVGLQAPPRTAMRICSATRSRPVTASVTGMLDLDAAVELEEEEVVAVEDELDRAGALVADRTPEGDRGVEHRLP